jgi:hypothetical protein
MEAVLVLCDSCQSNLGQFEANGLIWHVALEYKPQIVDDLSKCNGKALVDGARMRERDLILMLPHSPCRSLKSAAGKLSCALHANQCAGTICRKELHGRIPILHTISLVFGGSECSTIEAVGKE